MEPTPIWAPYCGVAPLPAELLGRWNLDPILLLAFLALGGAYGVWRRRGGQARDGLVFAAAGLGFIIFVSPLCALSAALFSARVLHHLILVAAIAPALAYAFPVTPSRAPLGIAVAVHAVVLWFWHAPAPYSAALSNDAVYWLMQATLLASAVVFWRRVRHAQAPGAVLALLATMMQMGILGALITFAGAPLYAPHTLTTLPYGLSQLQDQQWAGLLMWVPAAGVYLAAALYILGRALGRDPEAATS